MIREENILLIEPDIVLSEQYQLSLSSYFKVTVANTAQHAIDQLDYGDDIDIIVTDFMIGKNNGVELLHEIRAHDDWLTIPVILLSSVPASKLPIDKLETYGVRAFLYKPQTPPHELTRQVRRALVR